MRYPGLDVHDLSESASELGTQVRGAYWLNFYGQPVLGSLGGLEGLRQRLALPGVTCEGLGQDKAVVSLGEWPQTGETAQGSDMRPYRELARLLEPYLHEESPDWFGFSARQLRQWHRRFLD